MKTEICLILIILSAICKEPGDLSKAGVLKKKNPFFGLKLHPDDGQHIKRRLLSEDETLDPEKKISFKDAIIMLAEFLETKAEKTQGQKGLQKRVAKEFLTNKQVQVNDDVLAKIVYDSMSSDEILYFANKWTAEMYYDLLKNLSMYRDGMSVEEAIRDAETFGLSFQTWKLLKNEEHNWDDDYFDDQWNTHTRSLQEDNDDWVKRMEEDMQRMREEHEKRFPNINDQNDFPQPPPPEGVNSDGNFPPPPHFFERPPFPHPHDPKDFDFPRPPRFPHFDHPRGSQHPNQETEQQQEQPSQQQGQESD